MSSILCSKEFTLKINPDPTFQGLLWSAAYGVLLTGAGAYNFNGQKENFSLASTCGAAGGVIVNFTGADGTQAGLYNVPISTKTRNCFLHVDVPVSVAPTFDLSTGIQLTLDGGSTFHADNTPQGASFDHAFTLTPNVAHTLQVVIRHHIFGSNTALTQTGFLYVASYV